MFAADVSTLYQVIAEQVVSRLEIDSSAVHLDITSFHVDGAYDCGNDDNPGHIQLVKGYSRDHRPELNQVVLELICENQAGLPLYMRALSGNANDQKAFAEISRNHIQSLKAAQQCRYPVGDAALYTSESIKALHNKGQLFVSRVPMTIKDAKEVVCNLDPGALQPLGNGYQAYWIRSEYAEIPQRWLVIRSEQARKLEHHTLSKNILKQSENELKKFNKLCKQRFACREDAEQALAKFSSGLKFLHIEQADCKIVPVFAGSGRPQKGQQPDRYDYYLTGRPAISLDKIEEAREQAGLFILASNDLDESLTMVKLLATYKSQQTVERGFRFLKSPDFFVSSVFLKKPERIEALLMVMTCSLMIYAALEHRIRSGLQEENRKFPDMKKKPCQKPTARWVFCCFAGIHELRVDDAPALVIGLQPEQMTIIEILGNVYQQIYS